MTKEEYKAAIKQPSGELWTVLLNHFAWGEQSDEWWDSVFRDFGAVTSKYSGTFLHEYVSLLAIAYIRELESLTRERKEKESHTVYQGKKTLAEFTDYLKDSMDGDRVQVEVAPGEWRFVTVWNVRS